MYKVFKDKKAIFLALLLIFHTSDTPLLAQEIYKSQSASGKSPFYTSKKSRDVQEPAKLPKIMKVNPQGKIEVRQTCLPHGGVNCAAGRDGDGSVICYDGFKNSEERFNFSCTAPKIEIINIGAVSSSGSFKVVLRNLASAEAKNIVVKFRPDADQEFELIGPMNIKGFESGAYTYTPVDSRLKFGAPDQTKIEIRCANCP